MNRNFLIKTVGILYSFCRWAVNVLRHNSFVTRLWISPSKKIIDEEACRQRIAIFQFEWTLQIHTLNLAKQFARKGLSVDLFLKDCTPELVDIGEFADLERIRIYKISSGIFEKMLKVARRYVGRISKYFHIVPWKYVKIVFSIIQSRKYRFYIGVEKKGLIWATRLAKKTGVPVIYYSLELYGEGHPFYIHDPSFPYLRREEINCHHKTFATIIQDPERGRALERQNGMACRFVYLPVSMPRAEVKRTYFLHDMLGIPHHRKIVLYFGLLAKSRFVLEIARVARNISPDWAVVFHGSGPDNVIQELNDKNMYQNIFLSLSQVSVAQIPMIIGSSAIGLVFYDDKCENDRLIAFSSEKLAYFLQAGVPIVAFNNGNFTTLISRFQCGELIERMGDLPAAIEAIDRDYESFARAANQAYSTLYDYEKNFDSAFALFNAHGLA